MLDLAERVVPRLLEDRAVRQPERRFLIFGDEEWRFGDVDQASSDIARGLSAIGVEYASTVALLLPNCAALANSYFALGKLGAIAVPVNTAYRGFMLAHVLNDSQARAVIVDAGLLDQVITVLDDLPALETIVIHGGPAPRLACRTVEFAEVAAGLGQPPRRRIGDPYDANCVIYTSGTSGPSKGVVISNAHSVAKAEEVITICDVTADDVVYAPLPLFHSFALLRAVLGGVVVGGTCALRERFSASRYWNDVRRLQATVGYCVFSIPQILAKAAPTANDRDNTLRCMLQARYDPSFEERFGLRLIEGYGLTEAGMPFYIRTEDPPRPGSCGRGTDDWDVRLVDDNDAEVSPGEVGEIVLRPTRPGLITTGYLRNDRATAEAFRNLWFHTGDLARVEPDGFYYFHDRKSDSIRRRGENISSWEVETIIRSHADVSDVAAVPYPSDVGEDDVRVAVVPRDGATLTAEELIAFCVPQMADFMIPRYVEFWPELPMTQNGKTEKYRIRNTPLSEHCFDRQRSAPV